MAGSETSSNTLSFGILYMLLNPLVQERVQNEIDHLIPEDIPIDSSMKDRLPYTFATVLEIFRYATIAPTPAPREATEDFYFRGYHIKRGTCLITNVHATHFNEAIWGDPQNFRPERFLNSSGMGIDLKIADRLNSFGAGKMVAGFIGIIFKNMDMIFKNFCFLGKRYCLGQSLAETTIFLYFVSVIRRFKFVKVPGTNPSTEPILGITTCPKPFTVRIVDRSRIRV